MKGCSIFKPSSYLLHLVKGGFVADSYYPCLRYLSRNIEVIRFIMDCIVQRCVESHEALLLRPPWSDSYCKFSNHYFSYPTDIEIFACFSALRRKHQLLLQQNSNPSVTPCSIHLSRWSSSAEVSMC